MLHSNCSGTLDTQLAALLQTQAAEVEKLRDDTTIVLNTLLAAIPIAAGFCYLVRWQPTGTKISAAHQIVTATACLTTTTGLLSAQRVRSNKTGAALNDAASRYSHIADAAQAARPLHSCHYWTRNRGPPPDARRKKYCDDQWWFNRGTVDSA